MNVKILYDNESLDEGVASGLGFSCLIKNSILFDAGPSGEALKQNFEKLNIDASALEAVVISHDHWDHVGGLEFVTQLKKNLKVYICPGFDPVFKAKISTFPADIIEVEYFQQISSRVYSTGQIMGTYKDKAIAEQSLIIQSGKVFSLITGCAHPGIIKILKKVKAQLSLPCFHTVLGGFHLKNSSEQDIEKIVQELIDLKVNRVSPLHCTGSKAVQIFQKAYQERCWLLNIGDSVEA